MFYFVLTRGLVLLPCIAAYWAFCSLSDLRTIFPFSICHNLNELHPYWIAAIILIVASFGLATVRYLIAKFSAAGQRAQTYPITPHEL